MLCSLIVVEGDRRDEPDTATPMVGKQHNILLWRRKQLFFYNTKKTTVISRKPTLMDQRAQEGK